MDGRLRTIELGLKLSTYQTEVRFRYSASRPAMSQDQTTKISRLHSPEPISRNKSSRPPYFAW